ncbi:maleylpyruvate isomerase N-terminal domain-containing protein [Jatrophihabitans sp.]|uniref:maleylpyruvate isomerase N-terminal domain-containing protein n=1 Tax=Jatrophihabitans sp. TaxID=1932789 RepID=UPI0030C77DF6
MAELDLTAHIRAESARFGAALRAADPTAQVPTCPDWKAADLLWHLAEVQLFWAAVVRDGLDSDAADAQKPQRPTDFAELHALFAGAGEELLAALEGAPDDAAAWTWWPADQSVGFIRRRQAHEALIHRLDAELTASGSFGAIDAALAADGIDQALHVDLAWHPEWAELTPSAELGLVQAIDVGRSWLVDVTRWGGVSPNTGKTWDERMLAVVAEGSPSYTISGTAAEVDAWLWNRGPRVAVSGDEGGFESFQAVVSAGGN